MYSSKVIRSLSLLLLFSLFLTGFGSVNAKAATNLINPDFLQWENITTNMSPTGEELMNVALVGDNIYRLTPTYAGNTGTDNSMAVYMGWAIDLTYLRTGDSYTFTCYLPSPSELRSLTAYNHTDEYFANWVGDGYSIGFGSVNEDGQLEVILDFLNITKDNYLSLAGKKFVHSFECPDYSASNPGIYVWSYNSWAASQLFIEGSMSLVNNSAEDEEGFFSRLFEWFQEKFDNISNSFSDLGGKISTGLSGLGDRISAFFSTLGDNISNGLTNVKEGIQNRLNEVKEGIQNKIGEIQGWLTNLRIELINGIKGLFVPDEEYIKNWKNKLTNLLKDNLGIIYTAGDLITDLIEKVFDIVSGAPDNYGLSIPKLSFKASDGEEYTILDETEVSFDFMQYKVFKTMYGAYTVALYIFFGALEVKYAMRVYRKVMSN